MKNRTGKTGNVQEVALTPIHRRIHCVATEAVETPSPDEELEALQVKTFLDTLAEVALSIAKREEQEQS